MAEGLRPSGSTVVAGISIETAELLRLRRSIRPVLSVTSGDTARGECLGLGDVSPDDGSLGVRWWESKVCVVVRLGFRSG